MPVQLRITETTTTRGHSDVLVEAASPNQAAAIIARAHRQSVKRGSAILRLPDGSSVVIDPGVPETAIELMLLDEHGREVRPLAVPKPRRGRAKRE